MKVVTFEEGLVWTHATRRPVWRVRERTAAGSFLDSFGIKNFPKIFGAAFGFW
jgi:hypothetical protein